MCVQLRPSSNGPEVVPKRTPSVRVPGGGRVQNHTSKGPPETSGQSMSAKVGQSTLNRNGPLPVPVRTVTRTWWRPLPCQFRTHWIREKCADEQIPTRPTFTHLPPATPVLEGRAGRSASDLLSPRQTARTALRTTRVTEHCPPARGETKSGAHDSTNVVAERTVNHHKRSYCSYAPDMHFLTCVTICKLCH